LFESEAETK